MTTRTLSVCLSACLSAYTHICISFFCIRDILLHLIFANSHPGINQNDFMFCCVSHFLYSDILSLVVNSYMEDHRRNFI